MAGGAPVPVPTSDPDEKILSIADLEKAASKRLGKTARGNFEIFIMPGFLRILMVAIHLGCGDARVSRTFLSSQSSRDEKPVLWVNDVEFEYLLR